MLTLLFISNLSYSRLHLFIEMGCGDSKDSSVIVEVAYCGSCGWGLIAKKVCDAIRVQLPKAVIDCRPENDFTGLIRISVMASKNDKK